MTRESTPGPVRGPALSPTGVGGIRHEAFLYRGDVGFLSATRDFILAGLAADEDVLVAVTPSRMALLRAVLGRAARRVTFLDLTEVGRNPARIIPAWQEFLDLGIERGRTVRGIGEPLWSGRPVPEQRECMLHEALLNEAFAAPPAWRLRCPYEVTALDSVTVDEVWQTHPVVVDGGLGRISARYRPPAGPAASVTAAAAAVAVAVAEAGAASATAAAVVAEAGVTSASATSVAAAAAVAAAAVADATVAVATGVASGPGEGADLPARPGTATRWDLLAEPLPDLGPPRAEVAFGPADLGLVRAAATRAALADGLGEDRAGDLELAVHEVATNSIRHGGGRGAARFWIFAGCLICEVTDSGQLADRLAGRRRPDLDLSGGRGLWLVNQLCDLVQLRSGSAGTTVRMFMYV
ncbi:anti-sigma regulatory factor (Ser/Thr protein kinase) [Frankia torreyi]|uniref:Anti-sigma regulatory factor (Ser/Thr protein kinase) n=1 Tax=Frankia torreyi TaxID=1856 RepID=A0A0D8BDE4_9ACTN|nr:MULTISPECIES: MEDS domain-containing protein [Frankia]KJE22273.1 anti-sigma regulatory factor (Ser/Thr protein kinase) [Frankia torreyi]KQC37925.1 anti-sigma factor [Frankia sp. ACN1ag]KQM05069.1 anti-sigma regulatory factor (Ser/Thr protein kinase) [Frankia sp. CpI1-P]